jgi:hypothetical protein
MGKTLASKAVRCKATLDLMAGAQLNFLDANSNLKTFTVNETINASCKKRKHRAL